MENPVQQLVEGNTKAKEGKSIAESSGSDNEDTNLATLHQYLTAKQGNQLDLNSSEEDKSDCDTDSSVKSATIITQSLGTVSQIKNFFSSQVRSIADWKINEGCTEDNQSTVNEGELSQPCQSVESAESANSGVLNHHDQGVSKQHTYQHDESGKVNALQLMEGLAPESTPEHTNRSSKEEKEAFLTPKRQRNQRKKRKLKENSEEPTTPSPNSKVSVDKTLYPVFCKKDQSNRQDAKQGKGAIKKKKAGADRDTLTEELMDTTEEENFQVLDLRTVTELSKRLKTCTAELRKEHEQALLKIQKENKQVLDQLAQCKVGLKSEMETDIQKAVDQYQEDIRTLQKELATQKMKTSIMGGVIQQNHLVMQDLAKRLDAVELNNTKRMAVLSGLAFSRKKYERRAQLQQFFDEALGVYVEIEDSYFIGEMDSKSVVVIFETNSEKERVFSQKSKLNKLEGDNGQLIYLNHYLMASANEKARREREIIRDIKKNDSTTKQTTQYTEGKLFIGKAPYKKKVLAPTPIDILDVETVDLDRILKLDIVKGLPLRLDDNTFIPFAADVKDHQTIRDLYLKVRLMFARARHVICAYYIPGAEKHFCQDYVDDDDIGMARHVLEILQRSNIHHKVLFIVRFTGKQKIGAKRIEGYTKAAEQILKQNGYNTLLQQQQPIIYPTPAGKQNNMRKETSKKQYEGGDEVDAQPEASKRERYIVGGTREKSVANHKSTRVAGFSTRTGDK